MYVISDTSQLVTFPARPPELQWLAVIRAYLDEKINLGKAAELLDIHALELQEKFLTQGIPIRHGVDTLEEAHAEMAAILQWNKL